MNREKFSYELTLTGKQVELISAWQSKHNSKGVSPKNVPSIVGSPKYSFIITPCTHGTMIEVEHRVDGERLDITDYGDF